MITIPILIVWLSIVAVCFFFGFKHDPIFLQASSVLTVILGLVIAIGGIGIQTGHTEFAEQILDGNSTTTETTLTYTYQNFDAFLSNGIGLIILLLGIGFLYIERKHEKGTDDRPTGRYL